MRNATLNTILSLLLLLGLLGASSASYGAAANVVILMASQRNQVVSKDTQYSISCVPQQSSVYLWKCEDSYGNQFDNLIITTQDKNGTVNTKRARN